ncbi:MAG: hypothetical protein ABI633_01755 [Burkholderiales bacterium]
MQQARSAGRGTRQRMTSNLAIDALGYLASALVLATFSMRGLGSLRVVAIASNIAFIGYGALADIAPVLGLHALLLPMNCVRLHQAIRSRTLAAHASGRGAPALPQWGALGAINDGRHPPSRSEVFRRYRAARFRSASCLSSNPPSAPLCLCPSDRPLRCRWRAMHTRVFAGQRVGSDPRMSSTVRRLRCSL